MTAGGDCRIARPDPSHLLLTPIALANHAAAPRRLEPEFRSPPPLPGHTGYRRGVLGGGHGEPAPACRHHVAWSPRHAVVSVITAALWLGKPVTASLALAIVLVPGGVALGVTGPTSKASPASAGRSGEM